MTLKDLILKYEFDAVVPDLLTVDEPIKDNLYAFKETFDTLRRGMLQNEAFKFLMRERDIKNYSDIFV